MRQLTMACAILLASCATSPSAQFFTLTPVLASAEVGHGSATAPVQVVAVHIPPALDRQEMVRLIGPNELEISDQHRWGAPFEEMVQRVLTQDLAARRPPGSVLLPREPVPPRTDQLVLDILQFETDQSGTVAFDGGWVLVQAGSATPGASHRVHLTDRAGPHDYADQVAAMSRILGKLADDISTALAAPAGTGT